VGKNVIAYEMKAMLRPEIAQFWHWCMNFKKARHSFSSLNVEMKDESAWLTCQSGLWRHR